MVNLIAAPVDLLQVRTDFPYAVEVRPSIKIPLADGCWLHARAWIPETAEASPVPAPVEYAPFRHRDFTAPRDALIHPWFAGHGYASLRVELRGSGDSSGLPQDEYVIQEQEDAVQAKTGTASSQTKVCLRSLALKLLSPASSRQAWRPAPPPLR